MPGADAVRDWPSLQFEDDILLRKRTKMGRMFGRQAERMPIEGSTADQTHTGPIYHVASMACEKTFR